MRKTRLTTALGAVFLCAGLGFAFGFLLPGSSAALAAAPQGPTGQTRCDLHGNILDYLAERWGEAPVAMGVSNQGGLVEVIVNPKTGSWTIVVTAPGGASCIVSAGQGWRAPHPREEESKA